MMLGEVFLLGLNYWPRRKAMYWWKEFDEGEVEEEFKEVRSLGAEVVRFFLLWEDFQPRPDVVDDGALANLEAVLDLAHRYGLKTMPTLLVGHMSGANWVPEWALDEAHRSPYPVISGGKPVHYGVRDIYEDPAMLRAEKLLVRTVASTFSEHPAVLAWDLSNEVDNLRVPRSPEAAKRWCALLANEIRSVDPNHPVTLGLHQEDLEFDKGFHVHELDLDVVSMHGYPMVAPWAEGPLDTDAVPFLNTLTEALVGRPVLFQEFGLPTAPPGEGRVEIGRAKIYKKDVRLYLFSEEEAARYYEEVLVKLHRLGSLGALAWCFSDYDPCIWQKPPLDKNVAERFFGLTRSDGSLKPMGEAFKRFARRERPVLRCPIELDVPGEDYYLRPYENLVAAYREFKRALRGLGLPPGGGGTSAS